MRILYWAISCLLLCSFDEPKYCVVASRDNIELREYSPMLVAEVKVKGQRKEAMKDGFRILADYIFGNNSAKQKIPMTAPISEHSQEKIAVTAPAEQQVQGNEWIVRVILPHDYLMESAPKPNNQQISLIALPTTQFVVIRYSGRTSDETVCPQIAKLQNYIVEQKLATEGTPLFAYYNPPWTLPFLRRNEVMVKISEQ